MKDGEKQYISMREMLIKRSFEPITNCNCRKYKDGAFVDLLNKEMEELQNSMKEQEKQNEIDLMVEYMLDYARTLANIKTATEDSKFINTYKEAFKGYANFLYLAGYQNCKGKVVLSMEELNEIIKQTKETEKNYYKKVVIPQERKETAEKFLIKGKQLVEKWLSRDDEKVGLIFDFKEFIKKQFGIEIKENS